MKKTLFFVLSSFPMMAFAGPDGPAEVFLGLLAWTFIILGIIIIVKFFSLCKNVEKIYTLLSSMNKSGTDTSQNSSIPKYQSDMETYKEPNDECCEALNR